MPTRLLATFATVLALAAGSAPAMAASAPMGFDDARHLLARTGFGPTDTEVRAFAGLTREQAVTQLLRDTRTTAECEAIRAALGDEGLTLRYWTGYWTGVDSTWLACR